MNTKKTCDDRIRFSKPERLQHEFRPICLEELIGPEHEARSVWAYVCSLDLSEFYQSYKAVEGNAGRNPVHPQILLALWLYATIEGITSARHLADRCQRDAVYMWICGGVGVNRNLLNSFRTSHPEALNRVMTNTLATLQHHELIDFKRVSQDGMRVRAKAGKGSFRQKDSLHRLLIEAKERVEKMFADDDDDDRNNQQKAAQKHAAKDRQDRLEKALAQYESLAEKREKRKKGDGATTRVSTTDPEARNMKMADGGYRPAYNVQAATLNHCRLVAGVDVTNEGTDSGQILPMLDQIQSDYGQRPEEVLADGGFNSRDDVTQVQQSQTTVYSPVRKARKSDKDPYSRHRDDSDEVYAWRQRMKTPEAQEIYKERCSTAEFPFARFRNQGLQQFPVCTKAKTKAIVLLHAIAHNFRQIVHFNWLPVFTT